LEVVHHVAVVDHLVADVDRRAQRLDRALDDLDRAVDAGAEAAGIGEDDVHEYRFYRRPNPETLIFGNRSDFRVAHAPLSPALAPTRGRSSRARKGQSEAAASPRSRACAGTTRTGRSPPLRRRSPNRRC